MTTMEIIFFLAFSDPILAFYLEPDTPVEIEGSSPLFAAIRENQETFSQQLPSQPQFAPDFGVSTEIGQYPPFAEIPENLQATKQFNPPQFNPSSYGEKETRQSPPIFNNLQDLIQSFKQEPEPIAPTIITDDSFDKFQKISSMMGAILSDAGIGGSPPQAEEKAKGQEGQESQEGQEGQEGEEKGSKRAAIIPGPAQWPLVAFSFENAFLRATCPQIYDDAAVLPDVETQLDGIISQYCSMISNIINLKNDQLNLMVASLRKLALKKMVFQLASI